MRTCLPLLAALALLPFAGCINAPDAPYTPTSYWRLEPPPVEPITENPVYAQSMRVSDLGAFGDIQTKMMHRKGRYEVTTDEYNRWASAPELMLTQYLYDSARASGIWPRVFSPLEENAPYRLTGKLLRFERVDLTASCRLELTLEARGNDQILLSRIYEGEAALEESSGEALAAAMSEAVHSAITQFLTDARAAAP